MLNLDTTVDLDFKRFFQWWGRELSFLLPKKIKEFLIEKNDYLILSPDQNSWRILLNKDDVLQEIGNFERKSITPDDIKKFLSEDSRLENVKVVLRLTDQYAIAKQLTFPIAVAENLAEVISFELDRLSPFKTDQAYFSVKLLEKSKTTGQVRCMLVLAPKEKMDVLYDELNILGLNPFVVDYEGVENDLDSEYEIYNLLPDNLQQKAPILPKILYGALWGLLILLFIATLSLPVWWQHKTVNKLRVKIGEIEKVAQQVEKNRSEVDTLIAQTKQLIDKKNNSPSLIDIIDNISTMIEDHTWLTYFHYVNGQLQIQGQSPSASKLISLLEESEFFENARFVSPVTQDRRSGLERFQISVHATSKKQ